MNISFPTRLNLPICTKSLVQSLSDQQKKVTLVALAIIGMFALALICVRYCWRSKTKIDDQSQVLPATLAPRNHEPSKNAVANDAVTTSQIAPTENKNVKQELAQKASDGTFLGQKPDAQEPHRDEPAAPKIPVIQEQIKTAPFIEKEWKEVTSKIAKEAKKQAEAEFSKNPRHWWDQEAIREYFELLATEHPKLGIIHDLIPHVDGYPPSELTKFVLENYVVHPSWQNLDAFASMVNIGKSHYGLLYIDRKERTVEFFDSLFPYGDYTAYEHQFQDLAQSLTQLDAGQRYQYKRQLNSSIQKDGYECGTWTCQFLKSRLETSKIDFAALRNAPPAMIQEMRREMIFKLTYYRLLQDFVKQKVKDDYTAKFGLDEGLTQFLIADRAWTKKLLANNKYASIECAKKLLEGKYLN